MNARSLPRRSRATVAARPDIFLANAPRVVTATTAVVAPRSATSADRSATLRATALRVVTTAVVTARVVATVVVSVVPVVPVVANRPATHAVASATWPVTAPRVRSATTVSYLGLFSLSLESATNPLLGGEVGHVSRDCPTEAKGERMCYKCKQPGHVQSACPN